MSDLVEMILIPSGQFNKRSFDSYGEELPLEHVEIQKDFYISKYTVTQKQWETVMSMNPSHFKGEDLPVDSVTWYQCVEFCNNLSKLEGKDPVYIIDGKNITINPNAKGYRLLTGNEWEYAANANQNTMFSGSEDPDEVGWFSSPTHPVGQKKPNAFGLYDMSGNVWEWVWDGEGDNRRYTKGGCWQSAPDIFVTSGSVWDTYVWSADDQMHIIGFRFGRST